MTVWPSGLRRWLQAPVRKGVGSNPTAVTRIACLSVLGGLHIAAWRKTGTDRDATMSGRGVPTHARKEAGDRVRSL